MKAMTMVMRWNSEICGKSCVPYDEKEIYVCLLIDEMDGLVGKGSN